MYILISVYAHYDKSKEIHVKYVFIFTDKFFQDLIYL